MQRSLGLTEDQAHNHVNLTSTKCLTGNEMQVTTTLFQSANHPDRANHIPKHHAKLRILKETLYCRSGLDSGLDSGYFPLFIQSSSSKRLHIPRHGFTEEALVLGWHGSFVNLNTLSPFIHHAQRACVHFPPAVLKRAWPQGPGAKDLVKRSEALLVASRKGHRFHGRWGVP